MPNSCEQIKTEYENIKTLKEEFDLEYQKAVETGNLERVREMKVELEQKRDALQEKLFISPEKAKEIMGNEDFLGQEAAEKAFGIKLNKQEIPRIPFKREELERAKELNQFLVLRTNKTPDGQPLTMEKMNELLAEEFQKQNKGKLLYSNDETGKIKSDIWYKNEDFFKKDTPKLEWALTNKEIIPDSISKNYFRQTGIIADYLKDKVFKNRQMPKGYEEAIDEFEQQKQNIRKLMNDDRKEAAKQLSELKINQLTRQSPSEVLYDILIYFQNNNQRLLENKYTWARCSSDGYLVIVGNFDSDGAAVFRWYPGPAFDSLGVSFSRGL